MTWLHVTMLFELGPSRESHYGSSFQPVLWFLNEFLWISPQFVHTFSTLVGRPGEWKTLPKHGSRILPRTFNAILREQVLENVVRERHEYSLMFQVVIAFQEPAAIPADEVCELIHSMAYNWPGFQKCIWTSSQRIHKIGDQVFQGT